MIKAEHFQYQERKLLALLEVISQKTISEEDKSMIVSINRREMPEGKIFKIQKKPSKSYLKRTHWFIQNGRFYKAIFGIDTGETFWIVFENGKDEDGQPIFVICSGNIAA